MLCVQNAYVSSHIVCHSVVCKFSLTHPISPAHPPFIMLMKLQYHAESSKYPLQQHQIVLSFSENNPFTKEAHVQSPFWITRPKFTLWVRSFLGNIACRKPETQPIWKPSTERIAQKEKQKMETISGHQPEQPKNTEMSTEMLTIIILITKGGTEQGQRFVKRQGVIFKMFYSCIFFTGNYAIRFFFVCSLFQL